ncbi:unnamed protein product [Caenorhabditis nigoni]
MLVANERPPSNEPTLMIGDVDQNFDFTPVHDFIQSTFPYPIRNRKSTTARKTNVNYFYQYFSFEDARIALRKLNGLKVPEMEPEYQLALNFTRQKDEVCAHLTIYNLHLAQLEVMKLYTRYPSLLGLARYNFLNDEGKRPKTVCFIRFGDKDDCMEAVRELNLRPIENSWILMTISVRYMDELKEYVAEREANNRAIGMPAFHNFYYKRELNVDQFNQLIINNTYDHINEMEASRWSPVVFQTKILQKDYNRQISLGLFENM